MMVRNSSPRSVAMAWHRRVDHVGSATLAHKRGGEISPLGDHERMLANTHRPGRRR
jgi:hypothetical protein